MGPPAWQGGSAVTEPCGQGTLLPQGGSRVHLAWERGHWEARPWGVTSPSGYCAPGVQTEKANAWFDVRGVNYTQGLCVCTRWAKPTIETSACSNVNGVVLVIKSLQHKTQNNYKPMRRRHCFTTLHKTHVIRFKGQWKNSRSVDVQRLFYSGMVIFSRKKNKENPNPHACHPSAQGIWAPISIVILLSQMTANLGNFMDIKLTFKVQL